MLWGDYFTGIVLSAFALGLAYARRGIARLAPGSATRAVAAECAQDALDYLLKPFERERFDMALAPNSAGASLPPTGSLFGKRGAWSLFPPRKSTG